MFAIYEQMIQTAGVVLSRVLEPVVVWLFRINLLVSDALRSVGVPSGWHDWIIAALWGVAVVIVMRPMPRWLRLVTVLAVAVVAAKMAGMLPSS